MFRVCAVCVNFQRLTDCQQGPLELTVTTLPDPVPAHDEYLIEVRAAATNFFDLLQIAGKYQHVCLPTSTPGAELKIK